VEAVNAPMPENELMPEAEREAIREPYDRTRSPHEIGSFT
jgi:hypothetical protein